MPKNIYAIGVDIGATKTLFVLLKNQKVIKTAKTATPKTKKGLIKLIKEKTDCLKDSLKIKGVGVGVAGALDKKREKILFSPNLRYLNNFALKKNLEKALKLKVLVENDANCFVLAEAIIGAGKDKDIVFGITLGSGVGGGLIVKSLKLKIKSYEIYKGAFGDAGEIGHTIINFNGPKCTCGNFGCLEEYCSKRFFERKKADPIKLETFAAKGDKKAKEIFKEYGKYLGIGLGSLFNLLEPEVIVIGGGLVNARKHFLKTAEKEAKKIILSPASKKYFKIKIGLLGEKAGAVGAALLVIE